MSEASALTGLSRKVITGRLDRGTLRSVKDDQGYRRVPRTELERTGLLGSGHPGESGGELVLLRDLYEAAAARAEAAEAHERELTMQLVAIANAGPIRAMRLRREARRALAESQSSPEEQSDDPVDVEADLRA